MEMTSSTPSTINPSMTRDITSGLGELVRSGDHSMDTVDEVASPGPHDVGMVQTPSDPIPETPAARPAKDRSKQGASTSTAVSDAPSADLSLSEATKKRQREKQ